jgi:hypothetical protein
LTTNTLNVPVSMLQRKPAAGNVVTALSAKLP